MFKVFKTERVAKPAFVAKLQELGCQAPGARLFDLLDRHSQCFVAASDLIFLDAWSPPPYIFCRPDFESLKCLKDAFECLHDSLLKTWRKVLDRTGTMRMSWDDFCTACFTIPTSRLPTGGEGLPQTEAKMAAVWRAIDNDCSGWVALREFDVESFEALAEFKRWADRVHGGVIRAFRFLDSSGSSNAKLSVGELLKASRAEDSCTADLRYVFDGLDINNAGFLSEQDVKFLDKWDLAWEDWEAAAKIAGD